MYHTGLWYGGYLPVSSVSFASDSERALVDEHLLSGLSDIPKNFPFTFVINNRYPHIGTNTSSRAEEGRVYWNLGNAYQSQGGYAKAIECAQGT